MILQYTIPMDVPPCITQFLYPGKYFSLSMSIFLSLSTYSFLIQRTIIIFIYSFPVSLQLKWKRWKKSVQSSTASTMRKSRPVSQRVKRKAEGKPSSMSVKEPLLWVAFLHFWRVKKVSREGKKAISGSLYLPLPLPLPSFSPFFILVFQFNVSCHFSPFPASLYQTRAMSWRSSSLFPSDKPQTCIVLSLASPPYPIFIYLLQSASSAGLPVSYFLVLVLCEICQFPKSNQPFLKRAKVHSAGV